MRTIIQRVKQASVTVQGNVVGEIGVGYLILVGFEEEDSQEDILWLCHKINQLRIFNDKEGKMNLDIHEVNGSFLVVSQFTLHAKTKKGNRPSYIHAARPDVAIPLYEAFKKTLAAISGLPVKSGEFGADMQVALINDGPVTLFIDTKNKE